MVDAGGDGSPRHGENVFCGFMFGFFFVSFIEVVFSNFFHVLCFLQLTALKSNWALIRQEALDITKRDNFYTTVMERFVMTGGVKEFPLFFRCVHVFII